MQPSARLPLGDNYLFEYQSFSLPARPLSRHRAPCPGRRKRVPLLQSAPIDRLPR